MRPLTPKQSRFVDEYLVDLNAAAAARRAGYSVRTADRQGHENLNKPEIAAAVQAAMAQRSSRTQIDADRVLQEIADLAFSDLGEVLDFTGDAIRLRPGKAIPEKARRAIAAVKVKRQLEGTGDDAVEVEVLEFRLWPKVEALDKLARHLGLFKDKIEIKTVAAGVQELSDDELATIASGRAVRKPG